MTNPGELAARLEMARTEARHAFGDPTVFLERQITGARHVEVQVIADGDGKCGRSAYATARSSVATRR